MVFESLKQPVIHGYLVAGAIVGPGGLQLIKELVQVESLAQLGVQLLLFNLGRELSLRKLRSVWSVALLAGSLQIVALMMLGGLVAAVVKSSVTQGLFVGALLSMSSTSVVVKCLEAYRTTGSAFGQITIGTLILQDCSVGLMFALMPAFGTAAAAGAGSGGAAAAAAEAAAAVAAGVDSAAAAATASNLRDAALFSVVLLVGRVLLKLVLVLVLAAALATARLALPVLLRLLHRYASKELLQLCLLSLCLSAAWFCGNLGLSEELGAFIAGAMMSVAERQLVAAGLLLPSHDSPPATPRGGRALHLSAPSLGGIATSIGGGGGGGGSHLYSEHDSGSASPVLKAPADAASGASSSVAYYHRLASHAASELLKPGGGSGSSGSGLPIHAYAGDAGAAANGRQAGAAAAGGGGGLAVLHGEVPGGPPRPATSMCANIDSIQNVLTALFVASMGLIMSPVFLLHHAAVLLAGTVVVTAVKAAVVAGVVRLFGVPLRLSLAVGLSMAHIGEFSFVLLSMANQLQLLSSQAYMLLLGVTAMSLLTTPFVILAAIQLIAKEGLSQLYISGPRLRLSSSAGGGDRSGGGGGSGSARQGNGLHAAGASSSSLSGLHSSSDWAVVTNDGGGAAGGGGGIHRTTGREHRAAFNVARGGK